MATSAAPPQHSVRAIFGALMLVLLLASLDQTIMSTALPTIAGEFGGLNHLSWIVTGYMLASTIVTPIYGKLGDLIGRKVVLQGAIVLFLAGSVLCGLSQSMLQLVIFRAVQGLGGGGLMITTTAVIADVVPPRDRGRYQGYLGSVYALATVLGPLMGGFFVEHLSWRWIFYVNLPLGLVALAVIARAFTAKPVAVKPRIDVAGAALLAVFLSAAVLLTSLGGHFLPWTSLGAVGLMAAGALALIGFILVERRAAEPLLPLELFRNPTFSVACAIGFIVGVAMLGSATYMPLYLQTAKGTSPSLAGLLLTPLMGGILVTGLASGQLISRTGRYKIFPIVGTALTCLALGLLSTLEIRSSVWQASGYMLILGLGMGMVSQVLILAVQNAVDYRHLGVATSGVTLFRAMGSSVGVSLFGAIFTANLASQLAQRLPRGAPAPQIADAASLARLPPLLRADYLAAFSSALHPVFVSAAALAALAFALSWRLKEVPLRKVLRNETIGELFAMPQDTGSLDELELILSRRMSGEDRWVFLERIARRASVALQPDALWLLIQLHRRPGPADLAQIAAEFDLAGDVVAALAAGLAQQRYCQLTSSGGARISSNGKRAYAEIVRAYFAHLTDYLENWASSVDRQEIRVMLNRFSRDAIASLPVPPASSIAQTD